MNRRPYHAGSVLGPAPLQDLSPQDRVDWITRVRGYWRRGLASEFARVLLSFMAEDGALYPSLETIAARLDCAQRSVSRWVDRFEAAGFLRKINRRSIFGQTSNAYLILLPGAEAAPPIAAPLCQQPEESIYRQNQIQEISGLSMDSCPSAEPVVEQRSGSRFVPWWVIRDAARSVLKKRGPKHLTPAQLAVARLQFVPLLE